MENNEDDENNQIPLGLELGNLSDASWCSDTTARTRDSMSHQTMTSSEVSDDSSDDTDEVEEVYSLQDLYIPINAKVSNSVFPDPDRYPRVYHHDPSLVMIQGPPGTLERINPNTNILEQSQYLQCLMSTEYAEQADVFCFDNGAVDRDVPVRPHPVFNPFARLDRGHRFIFSDEETTISHSGDMNGE
jgi:hypothetical protein